jgi:hypothetical protein
MEGGAQLKRFATLLFGGLLAACSTHVPPPQATVPADPQATWGQILQTYVDDQGRVDFRGVQANRGPLEQVVAWVANPGPKNLAEHMNAYNALAMYNATRGDIPETLSGYRKVPFFFLTDFTIGGKKMSLYAYENDLLRPMGEERIHFALNCMVRACPRLPREPFSNDRFEAQLDRETRLFFSETRNLEVIDAEKKVRVSEILKFYTEDFLKKEPTLIAYINRYRSPPIPADYEVSFIPYDWTINIQPSRMAAR